MCICCRPSDSSVPGHLSQFVSLAITSAHNPPRQAKWMSCRGWPRPAVSPCAELVRRGVRGGRRFTRGDGGADRGEPAAVACDDESVGWSSWTMWSTRQAFSTLAAGLPARPRPRHDRPPRRRDHWHPGQGHGRSCSHNSSPAGSHRHERYSGLPVVEAEDGPAVCCEGCLSGEQVGLGMVGVKLD